MKNSKKITLLSASLLFFLFFGSCAAFAQEKNNKEIKLSSASLSSGEGPLSAGLFAEANFSRGNDVINVSLGERDMYVVYLKGFGKRFSIGPSFEYYYNVPLIGIMAFSTPIRSGNFSIGTMTWSGVSAGTPAEDVELLNWGLRFFWQSVDINYKNFTATGAVLYYDTWGPLVDFKYKQPINKNWVIFASAGYSWYGDGKALFKIGLTYKL